MGHQKRQILSLCQFVTRGLCSQQNSSTNSGLSSKILVERLQSSGSSFHAVTRSPAPFGTFLRLFSTSTLPHRGNAQRSSSRIAKLLRDYKQLSKAKLSGFVVLTAACGYIAGSGDVINWVQMGWTAVGTFGAAACANTLNQLYEVSNDQRMSRTCNRPLPAGRITRLHAAAFAAVMGLAGLAILRDKTNETTTALGAANILLYAGVYTPLKQLTIANTWVGAVVGAIPPLMGWSAAAGQLEPGAWVLATALFCWQMPHFLSLAWMCKDDYIRGGFKMLSMVDPTGRRTAITSLRHCMYLAGVGLLASLTEVASPLFAWEALGLAGIMAAAASRLFFGATQQSARKCFRLSLIYLPLLLAGIVAHRLPNQHDVNLERVQANASALLETPAGQFCGRLLKYVTGSLGAVGDTLAANNVKCPSKAYGDSTERVELQVTESRVEVNKLIKDTASAENGKS